MSHCHRCLKGKEIYIFGGSGALFSTRSRRSVPSQVSFDRSGSQPGCKVVPDFLNLILGQVLYTFVLQPSESIQGQDLYGYGHTSVVADK